jgi:hypothetical protein
MSEPHLLWENLCQFHCNFRSISATMGKSPSIPRSAVNLCLFCSYYRKISVYSTACLSLSSTLLLRLFHSHIAMNLWLFHCYYCIGKSSPIPLLIWEISVHSAAAADLSLSSTLLLWENLHLVRSDCSESLAFPLLI